MKFGQRLQNYPHLLERAYQFTHQIFKMLDPVITRLGYKRVDRWLRGPEDFAKRIIFDCRMCGQCILHSTGMTCSMSCPKNLRNGPCGGVRANGHCEVIPDMKCIWVQAYDRSLDMPIYGGEMLNIQPPVNRQLEGSSAWITMLTGQDKAAPKAWSQMEIIPLAEK